MKLIPKMETKFNTVPEEIHLGDVFNGTLSINLEEGRRNYSIKDFPIIDMLFRVRTIMGFQDMPCLSYAQLVKGRRYRFEIVNQITSEHYEYGLKEPEGLVICRALEETCRQSLDYESPDKSVFRQEQSYNAGNNVIVIPGKIDWNKKFKFPRFIFYDNHHINMTGFIFLDPEVAPPYLLAGNQTFNEFLGQRIKAKVVKSMNKGNRREVHTVLFDILQDK